jgi:tetratricopeptide (TPR) repeat protein
MEPSRWKNLWNALKPPPAVPRTRQPAMQQDSLWSKFWDAVKPPPPIHGAKQAMSPEKRRRLRWILAITFVVLIGGGGAAWGVHRHAVSVRERASTGLQEGMRSATAGNYAAAVDRFTDSITYGLGTATVYFQRGLAHQSLHQLDLAQADFEKAIQLSPSVGALHTALGSVFRQRGETQRAVDEFTVAINLDQDLNAYYQRGLVYESLGEHRKAIDDYNVAIRQKGDAPYGYLARALARENLGDKAGAAEDRQKGAELNSQ